jgi:hypothetical protein
MDTKLEAIRKLARAGEQAGISIDEMIQMLESGLPVETLFCLIEWRLRVQEKIPSAATSNRSALVT